MAILTSYFLFSSVVRFARLLDFSSVSFDLATNHDGRQALVPTSVVFWFFFLGDGAEAT